MEKVEGYALVNKNGEYLYFEQESETGLQTYSSKSPKDAELYETPETAAFIAINMINGVGRWQYYYSKEDKPVSIAKVTILAHVELAKVLDVQ